MTLYQLIRSPFALFLDAIDFCNDVFDFYRDVDDYTTNNISSAYTLYYHFYDQLITKQKFMTTYQVKLRSCKANRSSSVNIVNRQSKSCTYNVTKNRHDYKQNLANVREWNI